MPIRKASTEPDGVAARARVDEPAEVVDGLEVREHDPDEVEDGRLRDDAGGARPPRAAPPCTRAQPAVEGQERRLDREGGQEPEEDQVVRARPDLGEEEVPCEMPNAMIEASISSEPAIV